MNGNGNKYDSNGRIFFGDSRSQKRANNILGVRLYDVNSSVDISRSPVLAEIDKYLNNCQYKGKADWQECRGSKEYVKITDRKPKIIFPFAKVFKDRIGSKLTGASNFPTMKIEEDEEADFFLNKVLIPSSFFKPKMLSVGKNLALRGSAFIRFRFIEGKLSLEEFNSNYCYPEFDQTGQLEKIEIKYVFESDEKDDKGQYIKKWKRIVLTKQKDIRYTEPEYNDNHGPEFEVAESVEHNLGFVQGQWFRFGEDEIDGNEEPIIYQMRGFIDCLNYNLSQADSAASYGMDPQLVVSGIDEDEVDALIKSTEKAWLLGREGSAQHLETSGTGIQSAREHREDLIKYFQHITRLILLDPEKMVANAQSGKAMEVLHGPMVELINELRPWMEKGMKELLQKVTVTIVILNNMNIPTEFTIPPKWQPQSLDITTTWPPIFELTTQDKQQILSMGLQAANANVISRDTALRWIQSQGVNFGVEDFELEIQKVNTQQQFNTFGF